jgi:DNA mismatch endonuclease (patch repair protein)
MDVHTPEQRSRNMSRIRGRDTKPEMLLRKGLHAAGFRFRLHDSKLPGRPDLVLSRYRAVVQVHGCFWHGHDCPRFRWPASRPEFWVSKIEGNRRRDLRAHEELRQAGWRVATVWECALRGRSKRPIDEVTRALADFLHGDAGQLLLEGAASESGHGGPAGREAVGDFQH